MSSESSLPPTSFGNFHLVKQHNLGSSDISLSKWRSRVSGLNVIHLNYQAPIVKGYFVVPTEIFDDSGCPHTLEHLVFMGSEQYPYKGVLDNLANRAFSEGTNAWTDTDHTCYTIATAGEEGFLRLLPIYVDHVLYPIITEHGFVTEVHHVDPKGSDSGVVYSEMQGRENTPGDLMALRMAQLLNPLGSAYRSETGGLTEALRSLTVQQICDYHGKYYVPYNMCLVIAGQVSIDSLLHVLQDKVEKSILDHHQSRPENWRRPFVETVSANRVPLVETSRETIEFPEQDESAGELMMTFKGTAPNDYLSATAIDALASYLTSSPVAPLNKEFVEIASPLCTDISINENTRATFCDIEMYATSVPTDHLVNFDVQLKDALKRIADGGLDMKRMTMVLDRERRKFLSGLESHGGDMFSVTIISDFLYGDENGGSLPDAMDEIARIDELRKWSETQWIDILRKYFVNPPYAVVYGQPSAKLALKLEVDEKTRVDRQIAHLGQEGLSKAKKLLETAQEHNDRPIPSEYLTSFPLPDAGKINWISVQSALNAPHVTQKQLGTEELVRHISKDNSSVPFFVQYNHVKSDFVTVHAFLSAHGLSKELTPYLALYLGSFFSLPVKRQSTGQKLTHEEVINELDNETVQYDASLGLDDYFTQIVRISFKVETAKYESAIQWLSDLIYRSEFDRTRLEITIAKIQQSLPEAKRDGNTMVVSLSGALLHESSSVAQAASVLDLMEFIPSVMAKLKASPEDVVKSLEAVRKHLTRPSDVRFGVTGDVLSLPQPKLPWSTAYSKPLQGAELHDVPSTYDTLTPLGLKPSKKAVVMTLPSIESAYSIHSTRSIRGFDHPDYPVFRVALEVLNATEGFLWQYIRGAGLAYGAYVGLDVEAGLLSFTTYRSSNPFQAFQEARKVLQGLSDGTILLDNTTLESRKSALVYSVTKRVSTPGRAALTCFSNEVFRDVPPDHTVSLLTKYQSVTVQDVTDCLRKHFTTLFEPAHSIAAVVAGPSKTNDVAKGLESIGFEVERREISGDSLLEDSGDSESGSSSESEGSEGGR
ncbi:Metalloenzyme, LuxS/M16 peptidase-like protein [Hysterangium stoloniferum]|nr:Metalloenzyme, LuxS/M16 peptidase-like protein [Hysterangium stoloniferum]